MGAAEVAEFLTDLAVRLTVSASTQNQALNALVFLYGEVLHQPLGRLGDYARALRPQRIPVVLSGAEVEQVLAAVEGEYGLALKLLYGTGMRLFELLRLRVKDVDLDRGEITVRDGKGAKDRMTMVPQVLRDGLAAQLSRVRKLNEEDREAGYDGVWLPDALARKYRNAPRELAWQWVFRTPMSSRSRESGCAALWTDWPGVKGTSGMMTGVAWLAIQRRATGVLPPPP